MKMGVKLKTEYAPVLHMPVVKEGRASQLSAGQELHQGYAHPGQEQRTPSQTSDPINTVLRVFSFVTFVGGVVFEALLVFFFNKIILRR